MVLTNNLLRKSPTSPVVEGPPMFMNTMAVGPLEPVASCVIGGGAKPALPRFADHCDRTRWDGAARLQTRIAIVEDGQRPNRGSRNGVTAERLCTLSVQRLTSEFGVWRSDGLPTASDQMHQRDSDAVISRCQIAIG